MVHIRLATSQKLISQCPICPICTRSNPIKVSLRRFRQAVRVQDEEQIQDSGSVPNEVETAPKASGNTLIKVHSHRPRQEFKNWISENGNKFKSPIQGQTNYLGGPEQPFPLNSMFKPRRPLSEYQKNSVFDMWKKTPSHEISNISQKYGISLRRVEAIVRLKLYEQTFKKVSLSKAIESMTGAIQGEKNIGANRFPEPEVEIEIPLTRQIFAPISEADEMTTEQAAQELGLTSDLETLYRLKLEREQNLRGLLKSTAAESHPPKRSEIKPSKIKERFEWEIRDVNLERRSPSIRTKRPKPPVKLEERARLVRHRDGKLVKYDTGIVSNVRL